MVCFHPRRVSRGILVFTLLTQGFFREAQVAIVCHPFSSQLGAWDLLTNSAFVESTFTPSVCADRLHLLDARRTITSIPSQPTFHLRLSLRSRIENAPTLSIGRRTHGLMVGRMYAVMIDGFT